MTSIDYPRLRYLEAHPHQEQGKTYVILRDPTQISEQMLVVSPEFLGLLPLFDGRHSLLDIQAELTKRFGRIFFGEELREIIDRLDQVHFLESDSFKEFHARLRGDFAAAKVRSPHHAGSAYSSDAAELFDAVSAFYLHPEGAGSPQAGTGGAVRALVAPHIDLRSGGPVYTHAYRALAEGPPPDLFVIMGTGHMGLPQMFSISPKDFETPLGVSPVDLEFLESVKTHLGEQLFREDLSHRHEHTIEFQLVFLHHLFRLAPPRILPILCSFSYADLQGATSPHREWFARFVESFRMAQQETGRRICFIASVDFAHMGPRYGDSFQPDETLVQDVKRKDLDMLKSILSANPGAFLDYIASEQDQRRICGFPALYTLLHLLNGEKGRLLSHSHTVMDPTGSFVTYASAVFEQD
ncbi:MAG: AmmeMemoRadiSam system protein B [Acidobacteria bacterium]|nr:MAG: AmmeMemoRadiSam system protein B [Acidobacteriota bacterium]